MFCLGWKEIKHIHISLILQFCYSLKKPSVLFQEGSETAITIVVAIVLLLCQLYGSRRILCLDHVEQKVSGKFVLLERATISRLASEIFSVRRLQTHHGYVTLFMNAATVHRAPNLLSLPILT